MASGPRSRRRWVAVGGLLALAAAVRVSTMFYATLSAEDATVALVAKHYLSGENFPVFFYRQTYMGSLNGIHLVPALHVFGPSALLVRLNAIAWSLLFPLGLYLLGRRVFDEPTGRAALALAAMPPFLLTYWSTVAEPHFETNVFGVWLLLLAFVALTARTESARARALGVFGLLGGLAAWTNLKAVTILAPCLVVLTLRHPRHLFGRGGGLLAGGFLLGSLPAWLFYIVHGDRAEGKPESVTYFFRTHIDLSLAALREFWTEVVLRLLGTHFWQVNTPLRRTALALNCVIYLLGLAWALRELVRWRRGAESSERALGLALLWLTLAASLGAVYVSSVAGNRAHASRYALPSYIPLLVFTGAMVVQAGRRSRVTGAGLLIFLLLFAAWTNARFFWPLFPARRAQQSEAAAALEGVRRVLAARPVEAIYVDETLRALDWAFLLDRPPVSAATREVYVPSAVAADSVRRIDILAGPYADGLASDLAAVGAMWRQTTILGWQLFEDVRVPARGYRMVSRNGWRVAGDSSVPASVADGDLATAWPRRRRDAPPDPLVLDLGRSHDVARVIFWPSVPTTEVSLLRLSGSGDGSRWETLGAVPAIPRRPTFVTDGRPVFRPRNGWLELAGPPRPLRYLRVEPADGSRRIPWGVTELQVYEVVSESPPARVSTQGLVDYLSAHGLDRLFADPVWSARVSRATRGAVSTLIANGVVDNHGAAPPEWLAGPVRLRARDGLLVPLEDLPELRERLEAAGARWGHELLGDHALVRVLAPLASTAPCRPAARRATGRPPASAGTGQRIVLEAALAEETLVSGMRLWNPAEPGARLPAVQVAVSQDGQAWQTVESGRAVPQWGWAGRTLFAASDRLVEVSLDAVPARHVRVTASVGAEEPRLLCVRGARVPGR
jgi:4-amino-4-deoxy-L-arabinose transferase-like glycosyltransferase